MIEHCAEREKRNINCSTCLLYFIESRPHRRKVDCNNKKHANHTGLRAVEYTYFNKKRQVFAHSQVEIDTEQTHSTRTVALP